MFSPEQKQLLASVIEDLLVFMNHPEMPRKHIRFHLHVDGAESWSWSDIVPNWWVQEIRKDSSLSANPVMFGRDLGFMNGPIPMVMYCPAGHQHVDEGEWATRPHKTHQCQKIVPILSNGICHDSICGLEWRPGDFISVGVRR